jgi:hypothetical protein
VGKRNGNVNVIADELRKSRTVTLDILNRAVVLEQSGLKERIVI